MTLRRSATAVLERNTRWQGDVETEPWEVGWASEAIFFVRLLDRDAAASLGGTQFRVQLSPDGIEWIDEGSTLLHNGESMMSIRVRHFGGWLRLAASIPPDQCLQVIVYLSLKE